MCWALYLASDFELPQIPWNKGAPSFCSVPLADYERCVAVQFSLQHVIYLGSHQGCGCGFMSDESDGSEEAVLRAKTMSSLVGYLNDLLAKGAKLEMFLCWEGDQSTSAVARKELSISAFSGPIFPLGEKEFSVVGA